MKVNKNKLVILKGRFFCNECNRLIPVIDEVYCIPQDGVVICTDCYESLFKNRDDILVIGD